MLLRNKIHGFQHGLFHAEGGGHRFGKAGFLGKRGLVVPRRTEHPQQIHRTVSKEGIAPNHRGLVVGGMPLAFPVNHAALAQRALRGGFAGIPGVLKNAIDWGSRPYGQSVWGGKPAGIAGASPGAIGTALAQAQLRNVLSAVGVQIVPLPEVFFHFAGEPFDAQGGVTDARTRQFLQGFVDRFVQWAEAKGA